MHNSQSTFCSRLEIYCTIFLVFFCPSGSNVLVRVFPISQCGAVLAGGVGDIFTERCTPGTVSTDVLYRTLIRHYEQLVEHLYNILGWTLVLQGTRGHCYDFITTKAQ